jgi:hypothetical protein
MNKSLILVAAAALLFSSPAFAQKVSVGSTDNDKTRDSVFVATEYAKDTGFYDTQAVVEARLRSSNQHFVKLGVQRELATDGVLSVSGRVNLVQDFGKNSGLGWSVEPTAAFKVADAKVTLGYEFGDTFKSDARARVRNASVEVMYPVSFGDVGVLFESDIGNRREKSLSLVYVARQ